MRSNEPLLRALFGKEARASPKVREFLPASLFLVQHISASHPSQLPSILDRAGRLPALHPTEGMMIEPGKIYVAPPDRHLIIEGGHLHLGLVPKNTTSDQQPMSYFVRRLPVMENESSESF